MKINSSFLIVLDSAQRNNQICIRYLCVYVKGRCRWVQKIAVCRPVSISRYVSFDQQGVLKILDNCQHFKVQKYHLEISFLTFSIKQKIKKNIFFARIQSPRTKYQFLLHIFTICPILVFQAGCGCYLCRDWVSVTIIQCSCPVIDLALQFLPSFILRIAAL